jgi:hypothetical protein
VGSAVEVVALVAAAAVGGWGLCRPRSSRRQRLVSLFFVTLAASTLANLSGPATAIDRLTATPDLTVLLKNLLALLAVAGCSILVSSLITERSTSLRGLLVTQAPTAAAAVGMVALFTAIPRDFGGMDFVDAHADSIPVAAYGLLFQLCMGTNVSILGERLRRVWRQAPAGPLRLSLLLSWLGAMAAVAYLGNRMLFVVSHVAGLRSIQGPIYVAVSQTLLGTALLLVAAGGGAIAVRPVARWMRDYWSLQRLYPLWNDLRSAVPDIVLAGPRNRLFDVCTLNAARLRLYRRAIEIRDAQWALRGHMSVALREEARRQARHRGFTGTALVAVIEACVLEVARRSRLAAGAPPAQGGLAPDEGTADLDSEVRTLLATARASRTPFVRRFAASHQARPTLAAAVSIGTDGHPAAGEDARG